MSESSMMYISFSQGFKSGGANNGACNPHYNPENLDAAEIGFNPMRPPPVSLSLDELWVENMLLGLFAPGLTGADLAAHAALPLLVNELRTPGGFMRLTRRSASP